MQARSSQSSDLSVLAHVEKDEYRWLSSLSHGEVHFHLLGWKFYNLTNKYTVVEDALYFMRLIPWLHGLANCPSILLSPSHHTFFPHPESTTWWRYTSKSSYLSFAPTALIWGEDSWLLLWLCLQHSLRISNSILLWLYHHLQFHHTHLPHYLLHLP